MTAVRGHLTGAEFPSDFKDWSYPPPDRLFNAPIRTVIPSVSLVRNRARVVCPPC